MAPLPPMIQALLRIAVVGAPIIGRAFMDAYKQAMINAAARQSSPGLIRNSRMTVEEASKILDVKSVESFEEITSRYQKLYEANDPAKGGSAYIRSKVDVALKVLTEKQTAAGNKNSS